jgi:glycosyltransferase involved in cell wall biosynthesis
MAEPFSDLITIGVTCYNAEGTIEAALESAAGQRWLNKEIVVVDDCSTDGSIPLIRAFMAGRPDIVIRLIDKKTNAGYPAALNTILAEARGAFVAFFDDDDLSDPDRLEQQAARTEQYEKAHGTNAILCYTNRAVIREGETAPSHIARAIGRTPPEPSGAAVADYILWSRGAPGFTWGMFGSCTLMARASVLRALNGFDEDFRRCAEWDFAIRHALAGGHFVAVDRPLVTQRKTAGSDKGGAVSLNFALKLRQKHKNWLCRRHAYPGACLVARSRYYGAQDRAWASRLTYLCATMLCPSILRERLAALRGGGN